MVLELIANQSVVNSAYRFESYTLRYVLESSYETYE